MKAWHALLAVGLSVQAVVAGAGVTSNKPVMPERQLLGLNRDEAAALIAKLQDAQRRLKAGEDLYFVLVAGSEAHYDMPKVSPREAFLQIPFEDVWNIERLRAESRLWRPYRLSYAPDGLGRPYWDIEVALGFEGRIMRVALVYRTPAPL